MDPPATPSTAPRRRRSQPTTTPPQPGTPTAAMERAGRRELRPGPTRPRPSSIHPRPSPCPPNPPLAVRPRHTRKTHQPTSRSRLTDIDDNPSVVLQLHNRTTTAPTALSAVRNQLERSSGINRNTHFVDTYPSKKALASITAKVRSVTKGATDQPLSACCTGSTRCRGVPLPLPRSQHPDAMDRRLGDDGRRIAGPGREANATLLEL